LARRGNHPLGVPVVKLRLIDNAWTELHRLWSIRISLMCGAFTGIAAVIGAFTDVFNPWFLVGISVFVNTAVIPLSRLAKQKEAEPSA
jgi:hypothetical protein